VEIPIPDVSEECTLILCIITLKTGILNVIAVETSNLAFDLVIFGCLISTPAYCVAEGNHGLYLLSRALLNCILNVMKKYFISINVL
jgi:hypothetical protein